MTEQKHTAVQIADVVFSICSDWSINTIKLGKGYRDFLCDREPEVTIHVQYNGVPRISLRDQEKIFDSQAVWSLYRTNGRNVFVLKDTVLGSASPFLIAFFDAHFKRGEVHRLIRESERLPIDGFPPNPLDYPLGEVLMICLLAQGRGLMVHACGVSYKDQGILFVGGSGAGKSTLANLWKGEKDITVLSDDRIIIRKMDGQFWMYGTPWHGDANVCSPERAPLEKIFFLKHAKENTVKKISQTEATSRLIICSFPTFWDKKGMEFTLKFCAELAQKVPCYELGFVPDESILEFVRT